MTTALQLRRGTTAQHSSFTGANGEVTVDTDKKTIVVHDGATAGGVPLLPKTMTDGTANGVAYLNGSKVLTTGSALSFDGTNFATTGAVSAYSYSRVSNGTIDMRMELAPGLGYVGTVSNHPVAFEVNSTEQMRLTSTGLGIGTSSPSTKLHVAGNSATQATIDGTSSAFVNLAISGTNKYSLYYFNSTGTFSIGRSGVADDLNLNGGNLGLGVTPSAWSGITALQVAKSSVGGDSSGAYFSNNWYYNAGNKYIANGYATSYQQYSGQHVWFTAPSGTAGNAITFTQAMTLDASGNLSVGTTSVLGKLTLAGGDIVNTGSYGVKLYDSGGVNYYAQYVSSGAMIWNNGSERMRIDSSGNVGIGTSSPDSILTFAGNITSKNNDNYGIGTNGGNNHFNVFATGASGAIRFFTGGSSATAAGGGGTERMRIDSSGNLLVGATSDITSATKLYVSAASGADPKVVINHASGSSSGDKWMAFTGSASTSYNGSINYNGSGGVNYSTSSDYRLKTNIKPMTGALEKVALLNPVTYDWIPEYENGSGQGFIAHELQAVVPDCVTGEKDAVDEEGKPVYQGIDTSFLVATLTKAIQELKEQVDAQATEIAQLKGN